MEIQARVPPALCALHNFIRIHDPAEINNFHDAQADRRPLQFGVLGAGPAGRAERNIADDRRDVIAQDMWDAYVALLRERGQAD